MAIVRVVSRMLDGNGLDMAWLAIVYIGFGGGGGGDMDGFGEEEFEAGARGGRRR